MRNYYKVLEVSEDASPEAIKKSYLNLVKRWHPDRNQYDALSQEMMKMFNEAYEVLSDPQKKSAYDKSIRITPPETDKKHRNSTYKTSNDTSNSNANMSAPKPTFNERSFNQMNPRNGMSGYFLSQLSAPAYSGYSLFVGLLVILVILPLAMIYQENFFTPFSMILLVVITSFIIYPIVKIVRLIIVASKERREIIDDIKK